MNVIERFLHYVSFDTMSDPNSSTVPSTSKQLVLGNELVKEMNAMGVEDAHIDEFGIVYGWIPATTSKQVPSIGFIAHMDTAPDMSGEDVSPRIVKAYDGGVITLHEELEISMDANMFPSLKNHIGHDLIVTDGTTLLGADDKAGVAEIMTMAATILQGDYEHGRICLAFTPDEEVGEGATHFNIEKFGADYAYTVDGGVVPSIDYENFNAASASITIQGTSIHPGSSKNKMVNAVLLAMEFHALLPRFSDPAVTEGYEGFHHLHDMSGACEQATMEYIIRNHNEDLFALQKLDFIRATAFMNDKYGKGTIHCEIKDSYANMRQIIEQNMRIIDDAKEAMRSLGLQPASEPIRGGTDGARLTYNGLPCPNLGTGGYNYHGKYEYASVQEMELSVQLLVKIIEQSTK